MRPELGIKGDASRFETLTAGVYLIVHGGPAAQIDAKLTQLKLPPLAAYRRYITTLG